MRKWLFPIAVAVTLALGLFVLWAWSTDYFLVRQCRDAGGQWDADGRTCRINADRSPASLASLRG